MTREEFLILYQRFLEGACTQEEIDQLHAYQDAMQLEDSSWDLPAGEQESIREAIRARLLNSIAATNGGAVRRRTEIRRLWIAAAILAGVAIGVYYLSEYHKHTSRPAAPVTTQQETPGKPPAKKTYLTLGNGQVISLTDAAKGTVTTTGGIVTSKQEDGLVSYKASVHGDKPAIPDTNSIRTPYGERFAITLADGSQVWLNAASSLRFPVYFTDHKREVYLSGEACFEVKADPSRPFIVHVNGIAVQAVGTLFNVKSYPEESHTVATLIHGVVHAQLPAATQTLSPRQQLLYYDKSGRWRVQVANIETALAWKEGKFAFEKESIASIMREIGRWYNKEIVFVKGNKHNTYNCKFRRDEPLDEVIKKLELTKSLQFTISDNKIMVTILQPINQ